jgi:hypothetical protein
MLKRKLKLIVNKNFLNVNIKYLYLQNNYIDNINNYIFTPFFYNINEYFNYVKKLRDVYDLYQEKLNQREKDYIYNLKYLPLRFKFEKTNMLDSQNAILYGYKFHFKGRFTRKQKAASV